MKAALAAAGALAASASLAGCASPETYVVRSVSQPPVIDGRLDDPAWAVAPRSARFADIEGDARPRPALATHVRLAWDDVALYVAAEMEEPDVWASVTEHDAVVFHDDDFEVFLDPGSDARDYVEIEVNALGTVWDLVLPRPYSRNGSPRNDWESRATVATRVDGTLGDPSDRDRGWTVEMAIPWAAFEGLAATRVPPRPGDVWAADFSRVEWDTEVRAGRTVKVEGRSEHNWAWSPPGVVNMHLPWLWGRLRFER